MKLSTITETRSNDQIRFSVLIDDTKELYFEFPETLEEGVNKNIDSFVISLLPLAMAKGEAIETDLPISERVLAGIWEYQSILNRWNPETYQLVNISHGGLRVDTEKADGVGASFSGGVDSFYTVWKHNERQVGKPVTHLFFINGFDIVDDDETYKTCCQHYQALAEQLGLTLVTGKTNIREILHPLNWGMTHGAALVGTVHLFTGLVSRFYIASSHTLESAVPWGSSAVLDHWLSSEVLDIFHDACTVTRNEKIKALANWPMTYGTLRICWENPNGIQNCGQCEKCLRTMISLELLGGLQHYRTFPKQLNRKHVRALYSPFASRDIALKRNIRLAMDSKRPDIAFDLSLALCFSRVRRNLVKIRQTLQASL